MTNLEFTAALSAC